MKRLLYLAGFALGAMVLTLFFAACHQDTNVTTDLPLTRSYDYTVYQQWNDKFIELDRYAKGYRPGTGPRALAYLGLAAYESVVPGMPEHNSLATQYSGLSLPQAEKSQEYYWPACVNASYSYMMQQFFSQMGGSYPDLYNSVGRLHDQLYQEYAQKTSTEVLERSEAFGKAVATAVYAWEKTDLSGHDAFLDPQPASYVAPTGPGLWQPTWPDYSAAVFPYWGQVRRFAMREADLIARPPLPYNETENSPFYMQALETYNAVRNITANGPGAYDARWRAEFWSDDLLNLTFGPPTRMVAIANQVVALEKSDLATCAELYAKLGMAMSDAGVSVWKSKYVYNVERPVSYIRRILATKFPDAADWKPLLNNPLTGVQGITPAFPAYPSGHSGFGGAGGKILSAFFEHTGAHPGTYAFVDLCHKDRAEFLGTPRAFTSFKEMADEDAYSRIPLGVHYRMDCEEGVRLGELAAQRVLELPWRK